MAKNITWVVNCITMVGGVERVVCNISNYLVENGFNVKIISINTMKGQPFFPLSDKVQIEHCGYPVNDILDRNSSAFNGADRSLWDRGFEICIDYHSAHCVRNLYLLSNEWS